MPNLDKTRQIKYIGKDFPEFKRQLENLAKQYFPKEFSNFNDYSIEMMMLEMMAYVGDVISFNTDQNFKQLYQKYAFEPEAIFRNARNMGYIPTTSSVAIGEVQISQIVPAKLDGSEYVPDDDYAGIARGGSVFSDFSDESRFTLMEDVDMRDYEDFILESVDTEENPAYFTIIKTGKVRSGQLRQKEIPLQDPEPNLKLLVDSNVAYIDSIVDSTGNEWYQVDYLAEDTIFESIKNENLGEGFEENESDNPFILKLRRASRRFIVEHNSKSECHVQFGQGSDVLIDSLSNLSSKDLLSTNQSALGNFTGEFIAERFLESDSYGLIPFDTTLTIRYVTSNGEIDNANANTVVNIRNIILDFPNSSNDIIRKSFSVTNLEPITGARMMNDPEFIRTFSSKAFSSQRRCVTDKDYIIRSLLMPPKFGNISKLFVERDYIEVQPILQTQEEPEILRTRALNLYVLSMDKDKHLKTSTFVTKQNLANYLEKYRVVSDAINILDAFIVNIGVKFDFTAKNGVNVDKVLRNIAQKIQEYFDPDNFEINQPIVMEFLKNKMYEAEGVLTINNIEFENKWNTEQDYSGNKYDVSIYGSNYDSEKGILYPPADPSIFELKFPSRDIKGKHS